jgi:hypothetical protein
VADLRREAAAERVRLASDGPLRLGAEGGVRQELAEAVEEANQREPLLVGERQAAQLGDLGHF